MSCWDTTSDPFYHPNPHYPCEFSASSRHLRQLTWDPLGTVDRLLSQHLWPVGPLKWLDLIHSCSFCDERRIRRCERLAVHAAPSRTASSSSNCDWCVEATSPNCNLIELKRHEILTRLTRLWWPFFCVLLLTVIRTKVFSTAFDLMPRRLIQGHTHVVFAWYPWRYFNLRFRNGQNRGD